MTLVVQRRVIENKKEGKRMCRRCCSRAPFCLDNRGEEPLDSSSSGGCRRGLKSRWLKVTWADGRMCNSRRLEAVVSLMRDVSCVMCDV
jgi:hypothetical protein